MRYVVKERIEMDCVEGGNCKNKELDFNNINQALNYIKNRMYQIIKDDTKKFFVKYHHSFKDGKFTESCKQEFDFWLSEADELEQYCYVASYLGWSCFWFIEKEG
jgi:hypothetical protein